MDNAKGDAPSKKQAPPSVIGELFGVLFCEFVLPFLLIALLPFAIVYYLHRFAIWFYENELKKPELRKRSA